LPPFARDNREAGEVDGQVGIVGRGEWLTSLCRSWRAFFALLGGRRATLLRSALGYRTCDRSRKRSWRRRLRRSLDIHQMVDLERSLDDGCALTCRTRG
jgi:hypothetical protein